MSATEPIISLDARDWQLDSEQIHNVLTALKTNAECYFKARFDSDLFHYAVPKVDLSGEEFQKFCAQMGLDGESEYLDTRAGFIAGGDLSTDCPPNAIAIWDAQEETVPETGEIHRYETWVCGETPEGCERKDYEDMIKEKLEEWLKNHHYSLRDDVDRFVRPNKSYSTVEERLMRNIKLIGAGFTPESLMEHMDNPHYDDAVGVGGFIYEVTGSPTSNEFLCFLAKASGLGKVSDEEIVEAAKEMIRIGAEAIYQDFGDEAQASISEDVYIDKITSAILESGSSDPAFVVDEGLPEPVSRDVRVFDVLTEHIDCAPAQKAIMLAAQGNVEEARKIASEFADELRYGARIIDGKELIQEGYVQRCANAYADRIADEGVSLEVVRAVLNDANWEPPQPSLTQTQSNSFAP